METIFSKRVFLLILVFCLAVPSLTALAANCGGGVACNCGDTVTASTTLSGDLSCLSGAVGLTIGTSSITIDGGNHIFTGSGYGATQTCISNTGFNNVTIQNFANIKLCNTGILYTNTSGGVIQNNIFTDTQSPVGFTNALSVTVSSNTMQRATYSVALTSTSSATITGNTFLNGYSALEFGSYSATSTVTAFSNNNVINTLRPFYTPGGGGVLPKFSISAGSNNNFLYPVTATPNTTYSVPPMIVFSEPASRTVASGTLINFSFTLNNAFTSSTCPTCTYTAVTLPAETVSSTQVGNAVSGSFTPQRVGTYSLVLTATDGNGNFTKRNYFYFVNANGSTTTRIYLQHPAMPWHGKASGTGADGGVFLAASTTVDQVLCTAWIQASPDLIPSYPYSSLSSVFFNDWYTGIAAGYANFDAIQRYYLYDGSTSTATFDFHGATLPDSASPFLLASTTFSNLNWGMDNVQSWYWLTMKHMSFIPQWLASSGTIPTYIDMTYTYTTSPGVFSNSNVNVELLSSSASSTATSTASIVLDNPLTSATSTSLVLPSWQRPFQNGTTTIGSDATSTVAVLVSGSVSTTLSAVSMTVAPSQGSVDVGVSAWGTNQKTWTETSGTAIATSSHVITGLTPSSSYILTINSGATTTYTANASGTITFVYTGGY